MVMARMVIPNAVFGGAAFIYIKIARITMSFLHGRRGDRKPLNWCARRRSRDRHSIENAPRL